MRAILLTSSVLILALVLLRTLLRGHISLRLQYALWLLVAVRLLVPFELGQSAFSILSLANQARETPAVQAIETVGSCLCPPSPLRTPTPKWWRNMNPRASMLVLSQAQTGRPWTMRPRAAWPAPPSPSFSPPLAAGSIWLESWW